MASVVFDVTVAADETTDDAARAVAAYGDRARTGVDTPPVTYEVLEERPGRWPMIRFTGTIRQIAEIKRAMKL